jgi:hypothetical protein
VEKDVNWQGRALFWGTSPALIWSD